MSRYYELLTESEQELGQPETRYLNGAATGTRTVVPRRCGSGDASDEQMQRLVQRVFLSTDGTSHWAVVFCGVDPQNNSSSVCARAARALAANNQGRVCMVDANLSSRRLSGLFAGAPLPKLPVAKTPIVDQCGQIEGNLWLAGPGVVARDRTTLPPDDELKQLMVQLRDAFDYVLIDAPGTSVCGHAQSFGLVAGAAILVIEANCTRRLSATNAQDSLTSAGVRVLGTVLYNRSFPIPERLYKRL